MDEDLSPPKSPEGSQFIVDPLNASESSINCGIYAKSFSYTKHYNNIKMKYKTMLLGWILATFVAFSYILSGKEISAPFDKMISIAFVAIFSSRGVLLLLLLDTQIYHRLLNSSFSTNLDMEMKGISKARIHINMVKSLLPEVIEEFRKEYESTAAPASLKIKELFCWIFTGEKRKGLDPVFYDGLFYCGSCFCLWVIAGVSISIYLYYQNFKVLSFCGFLLSPLISMLICIHLIRKTLKSGINKFKEPNE